MEKRWREGEGRGGGRLILTIKALTSSGCAVA